MYVNPSRKRIAINRLTILREHLKEVVLPMIDGHKFDWGCWWARSDGGSSPPTAQEVKRHTCGTTACVAGWGALNPKLRKAGLRLRQWVGIDIDVPDAPGDRLGRLAWFFGLTSFGGGALFLNETGRPQYGKKGLRSAIRLIDKILKEARSL